MGDNFLVLNCGSSSVKVSLFSTNPLKRICNITDENNLEKALSKIDVKSIAAVGHRFVHGGLKHVESTFLNKDIIHELELVSDLAPLHNKSSLEGIKICFKLFGDMIPEIAVFDTAFHKALPSYAANYALPLHLTEKYSIKRYGFHGISHAYLWEIYSSHMNRSQGKIITIHLGSGCSITAIKDGKSIDTSMGFSPGEGLIMGTRAGDIDSSVIEFLCRKENLSPQQVLEILNHQSGLLGISEMTSNMQILEENLNQPSVSLAIEMFCYRITKYVGSYISVLQGCDAIIFSGGIGENSPLIREKIISAMKWYHIEMDKESNQLAKKLKPGDLKKLNTEKSSCEIFVIGTDENFYIANQMEKLVDGS